MKILNNISPLPFYDSLQKQNHRKSYAYGQIYPLLTPLHKILPFQIRLLNEDGTTGDYDAGFNEDFLRFIADEDIVLTGARLYNMATGFGIAVLDELLACGLKFEKSANQITIAYYNTASLLLLNPGQYYLELIIGGSFSLYSEVFTVVPDTSKYLALEYYNSINMTTGKGFIDFSDNFKFLVFLNTQLGKPEYVFEEEVTERMGYTFSEYQLSKKVYRFTFLAPEYLCDALRIVRLCDHKVIVSQNEQYIPSSFSIAPKWEEQGDLAAVECEFETDTVISTIGNLIKYE